VWPNQPDAACAPIEQVGANGPVELPDTEIVDDIVVPFGGGDGRRFEIRFDAATPAETYLSVSVDRNSVRCVLSITGPVDAVDAQRDEFEMAMRSFMCDGV
jgi:hypothetical protein